MKTEKIYNNLSTYVSDLAHELLNRHKILHFMHHVTDSSVFIYVSKDLHPYQALLLLRTLPIIKSVQCGIDEKSDCWVEIFFK